MVAKKPGNPAKKNTTLYTKGAVSFLARKLLTMP